MEVYARSVNAVVTGVKHIFAHVSADAFHHFVVKRSCKDRRAGIAYEYEVAYGFYFELSAVSNTYRPVFLLRSGKRDGFRTVHLVITVSTELSLFFPAHLVEKLFPQLSPLSVRFARVFVYFVLVRRVFGEERSFNKLISNYVAFVYVRSFLGAAFKLTVSGHKRFGFFEVEAVTQIGFHVRVHLEDYSFGIGFFPVAAAQIRSGVFAAVFVKVDIAVGELIRNLSPRISRIKVLFVVLFKRYFVNVFARKANLFSVAAHYLLVAYFFALFFQNVVQSDVRVGADGQVIIARFYDVSALVIVVSVVEGLEVLALNGDFYRFGSTLFEELSFCVSRKFDCGFFQAFLLVVSGVRLLHVNLYYFFAFTVAAVFNCYAYFVVVAFLFDIKAGIIESRVRNAVAERESDFFVVIPTALGVLCAFRRGRFALT